MPDSIIAAGQIRQTNAKEYPSRDSSQETYKGRSKYNQARSFAYQRQDARKNLAEIKLIKRAFAHVPKGCRVLDLPSGGGRAAISLAYEGYEVMAGDLSPSMREIAAEQFRKAKVHCPVYELDIENLDLSDRSIDAVLCFRLFHHFPNREIRRNAVAELCRVTRHYVVLSYLDYWSYTAIWRRLRKAIAGKPSAKYANTLAEVVNYFHAYGFEFVKDYARAPFFHSLHLAVFQCQAIGGRS